MDKRVLRSRILVIIGLVFMGIGLIYPGLIILGIAVAAVGALLSKSPRRRLLLWGAGLEAFGLVLAFILGLITGMRGKTEIPSLASFLQGIPFVLGFIITVIGGISILAEERFRTS